MTGLSRATIAVVVDELLEMGVVTETGSGDSKGGRPPIILQFCPTAALAIGASLYDFNWHIVATDLSSHVVDREVVRITDSSAESAMTTLAEGVRILRGRLEHHRILPAIGIGPPGLVDMEHGIIKSAVDLGWKEVDVASSISEQTGFSAIVANRSKAGALAVLWRVAKPRTDHLIYISLGTGVAAGIILNGRLFTGANSSAGELGHMTVVPEGPLCECGNRGCLQQYVSEQAIANAARHLLRDATGSVLHEKCGDHPELLDAFDVLDAAERGDTLAVSVVDDAARYLAIATGNLVNLFNPQTIVLGGPVADASPLLTELVRRYTKLHAMAYPYSAVRIVSNTLGPDTGAIGAAVLVLQHADRLFFQLSNSESIEEPV